MKLTDLTESTGTPDSETSKKIKIKMKREPRITLGHLLKMRDFREKEKIERLKTRKLYKLMYAPEENTGGSPF